jgi:hypothetical protein
MITLHDIDFEVEYRYETEYDQQGEFKVLSIEKVYLNGLDVTEAFTGELLEQLKERLEQEYCDCGYEEVNGECTGCGFPKKK